ncbi:MAG: hypothetical protein ACKVZJ_15885 [Phycisphaerales bacterium]
MEGGRNADDIGTMKTLIDGRVLEVEPKPLTLGRALEAVRGATPGRLVIEVVADGRVVTGEELSEPPTRSPFAGELHVKTADAGLLLRESLLFAADTLRDLGPRQAETADLIQSSKTAEAMAGLTDILGAWDQAKQVMSLAGTLGVRAPVGDDLTSALSTALQELRRSLQQQDWASLGDTLAYDLPELSGRWADVLGEMAVGCGSGRGASAR